jgi:PAS domain S-box-containing protein
MKILVVDDNIGNIYLLEAMLKGTGHDVVAAANGAEALEKLHAEGFDMIISDILMPVMDGFRLCRECKGDEKLKDIPFIVYTASYMEAKDEELASKVGADKFLRKPIEVEEFIAIIQGMFRDLEEGKLDRRKPIIAEEKEVFKLYSERLVNKLEQKMLDLETEITERKRAEGELRESEEKYRTILEDIDDGYYEVDFAGNFTFFNDPMWGILGYSKDELMGMNNRQYMDKENAKKVYQAFNRVYTTGKHAEEFGWETIRKDGTKRFIEASVSLKRNAEGEPIGFRGIAHDVTEHKRAEEELRKAYEELQQLHTELEESQAQLVQTEKMSALGTMTGGVAHELNNPMMGILNFIQYCLKHTSSDERTYPVLQDAERAAERCISIVQDLLTFCRMDTKVKEKYEKVDLIEILERVLRLLSYRTEKERVSVATHYADQVPEIQARANAIEQVFLNLMINALDALKGSEKKEVHVDIQGDGEFVRVRVADTGCGIAPEAFSRIFDPFFTTKPTGQGTGLGLSVCQGAIQAHGGEITCESEPGAGTTFNILLPIKNEEEAIE